MAWAGAGRARMMVVAMADGAPLIGRPYLITPKQALRIHRMICTGEVSLLAAETQLGLDRQALARGFERYGLARPWLDDTPPDDGAGLH